MLLPSPTHHVFIAFLLIIYFCNYLIVTLPALEAAASRCWSQRHTRTCQQGQLQLARVRKVGGLSPSGSLFALLAFDCDGCRNVSSPLVSLNSVDGIGDLLMPCYLLLHT